MATSILASCVPLLSASVESVRNQGLAYECDTTAGVTFVLRNAACHSLVTLSSVSKVRMRGVPSVMRLSVRSRSEELLAGGRGPGAHMRV